MSKSFFFCSLHKCLWSDQTFSVCYSNGLCEHIAAFGLFTNEFQERKYRLLWRSTMLGITRNTDLPLKIAESFEICPSTSVMWNLLYHDRKHCSFWFLAINEMVGKIQKTDSGAYVKLRMEKFNIIVVNSYCLLTKEEVMEPCNLEQGRENLPFLAI